MTDGVRKLWERRRAAGQWKFILFHGVIGFGLVMFVAMTFVVEPLLEENHQFTPLSIVISLLVWSFGGLIFGLIMWYVNERMYRKGVEKEGML